MNRLLRYENTHRIIINHIKVLNKYNILTVSCSVVSIWSPKSSLTGDKQWGNTIISSKIESLRPHWVFTETTSLIVFLFCTISDIFMPSSSVFSVKILAQSLLYLNSLQIYFDFVGKLGKKV